MPIKPAVHNVTHVSISILGREPFIIRTLEKSLPVEVKTYLYICIDLAFHGSIRWVMR